MAVQNSQTVLTDPNANGLLDPPATTEAAPAYDPTATPTNAVGENTTTEPPPFDYTANKPDTGAVGDTGLLDPAVNDLNTLLDQNNPLMTKAKTRGKQFAADRGLLNSTLAGEASQSAALDVVMPLTQQNMQNRQAQTAQNRDIAAQMDLSNQGYQQQAGLTDQQAAIQEQRDILLANLDLENRTALVDLEMQWNQQIQSDLNATQVWSDGIKAIGQILNNVDMDPEQQRLAVQEQLSVLNAGLNFIGNLNSFGVDENGIPTPGNTTQGAPTTTPTIDTTTTIDTLLDTSTATKDGARPLAETTFKNDYFKKLADSGTIQLGSYNTSSEDNGEISVNSYADVAREYRENLAFRKMADAYLGEQMRSWEIAWDVAHPA